MILYMQQRNTVHAQQFSTQAFSSYVYVLLEYFNSAIISVIQTLYYLLP